MNPASGNYRRGLIAAAACAGIWAILWIKDHELARSLWSIFVALIIGAFLAASNRSMRNIRERMLESVRARCPEFKPNKELSGDARAWGFLVDESNRRLVIYARGGRDYGLYRFGDLISAEVTEDGSTISSTVRSSQVVGAVVGNALLGGVGLAIGALTGKSRTKNEVSKITLSITLNDTSYPRWNIPVLDVSKPILRSKPAAQAALKIANEAQGLLTVLIRQAEEKPSRAAPTASQTHDPGRNAAVATPQSGHRAAFADEFAKLAKLRDQGVLSDQEFAEMKSALISRARNQAS